MPEIGPIEVDVRLEMKDLFPVFFVGILRRLGWMVLPISVVPLFLWTAGLLGNRHFDLLLLAPLALWPLIFLVLPYASARSALRSSKAIQNGVHYKFSENGVDAAFQRSSTHMDWSNLQKIMETRRVLLIYTSKQNMWALPKRCFASPANLDELRHLIRERFPGKTSLRES